ncbi:MAG: hypothetical protein AAF228_11825 [Pseudomonadota bacterium]
MYGIADDRITAALWQYKKHGLGKPQPQNTSPRVYATNFNGAHQEEPGSYQTPEYMQPGNHAHHRRDKAPSKSRRLASLWRSNGRNYRFYKQLVLLEWVSIAIALFTGSLLVHDVLKLFFIGS